MIPKIGRSSYGELLDSFMPLNQDKLLDIEWSMAHDVAERKVKQHISAWLIALAKHIESSNDPLIETLEFPTREADMPCRLSLKESFLITFSHPWPG